MRARSLLSVAGAALVVTTLAACSAATLPGAATPTATPTATTIPTALATPTATPSVSAAPGPVLFRITATAKLPTGATADLVETVYQPSPLSAAEKTTIVNNCGPSVDGDSLAYLNGQFASSVDLSGVATATLQPGSPAWSTSSEDQLLVGVGGYGAYVGAYHAYQTPCSSGFITVPGTQTTTTLLPASDPADSSMGWTNLPFGFSPSDGGDDNGGNAVVSNCTIQLSAAAAANPATAKWAADAAAWPKTKSCFFLGNS